MTPRTRANPPKR